MLVELNVKNFAILENLNINFTKGFNVLTGETGAGKSIIVEAISLILGERASRELIRTGCDKAFIEGIFYLEEPEIVKKTLTNYGIELSEDNYLILSREIFSTGRSVSRVNGRTVTLAMLNRITKNLIDIHGQHEHQSLLNVKNHIKIVDAFGDIDFINLKKNIANSYKELMGLKNKVNSLTMDAIERDREIDLLKYQIEEIDNANLSIKEEKEVEQEYNTMANAREISTIVGDVINILNSDDYNYSSIIDQLNSTIALMNNIEEYDEKIKKINNSLENINFELQEISVSLMQYMEGINYNEERMTYLEDRIDIINTLKKKYGNTIEEIFEYRNKISKKLDILMNIENEIRKINIEISKLEEELSNNCKTLSNKRKNISKEIERSIAEELSQLNMEKVVLKINFEKMDYFTSEGFDKIEFLISTNLGEELKPLSKIASGGEISRIMLAFKTILANYDDVPCLIFDEIDTGISGRTAQIVGEKINKISKNRQVICISHLPQIAALADTHFSINKRVKDGKTVTDVKKLSYNDRIKEMSRLLGGVDVTDTTELHAKEMLEMSKKFKNK